MILINKTKIRVSSAKIKKVIAKILQILSIPDADLDLTFVGDRAMQTLNKKFRQKNRSTDVLSFPLFKKREARSGNCFLGDLAISLPMVKRQAKKYGKTFQEELYFLIVHGVLHLLGYDHEKTEREAKEMRRMEKKILGRIRQV